MALARLPCTSTVPSTTSRVRATATAHAPARASLRPVPRTSLVVVMRGTPTDEGMQSEENPYDVPQTGRKAPMSEDKHADTPEQMAAPEGDKAIEGQKWQPTEQDGETPEDRYGSKAAAEEMFEAHKDKSRKSEKQTGDMDGDYAKGGA